MIFENNEKFLEKFLQSYRLYKDSEDFPGVSIVTHYNVMIDILNILIKQTGLLLFYCYITEEEIDGYADEYILTVDSKGQIWVQEAKYDTGYITTDDAVIYIHSDCSSSFVGKNKDAHMIEFDFSDPEKENIADATEKTVDTDKYHSIISKSKDGCVNGFSSSWLDRNEYGSTYSSYSYYSNNEEEVKQVMDSFGIKY